MPSQRDLHGIDPGTNAFIVGARDAKVATRGNEMDKIAGYSYIIIPAENNKIRLRGWTHTQPHA